MEMTMLTLDEAKTIAKKEIPDFSHLGTDMVIVDEDTITKPYGWVFFFGSKQFAETGDVNFFVGGNGPLVVRHNGKVYRLISAGFPEEVIAAFEKKHGLRSS